MAFDFLNGENGEKSSKRVITFLFTAAFLMLIIANLFFGKELKQSIEDNLTNLIMFSYGGVSLESLLNKFGGKNAPKVDKTETTITQTQEQTKS